MPHAGRVFLGAAAVLLVVAVPLLYSSHQQTHLRNFRVVEDGVLYRSGQLSRSGFERVLRDYRIRTVITLRTSRVPGVPPPDSWEEGVCAAQPVPVRHVRIVPRVWSPDETGGVPAEEGIKDFLAVMDDPANRPVLVHCFAGVHRTGTMCAIFRMEYHRWDVDEAMTEMAAFGYDLAEMHEHVESYLRGYRPRWKRTDR